METKRHKFMVDNQSRVAECDNAQGKWRVNDGEGDEIFSIYLSLDAPYELLYNIASLYERAFVRGTQYGEKRLQQQLRKLLGALSWDDPIEEK
jgi:hypothetical protein